MINKNKMIFGGTGLLIGMILVFYLAAFVVPKALTTLTNASTAAKVSVKNSFLIGEKIVAKADGIEKCVVNVFVIDEDGKGILGKQVTISGLTNLTEVTDKLGKASFELTSTIAKQYEIAASVNGLPLTNMVKVTFRN